MPSMPQAVRAVYGRNIAPDGAGNAFDADAIPQRRSVMPEVRLLTVSGNEPASCGRSGMPIARTCFIAALPTIVKSFLPAAAVFMTTSIEALANLTR